MFSVSSLCLIGCELEDRATYSCSSTSIRRISRTSVGRRSHLGRTGKRKVRNEADRSGKFHCLEETNETQKVKAADVFLSL